MRMRAVAAAVIASCALSGCGDSDDSNAAPSEPAPESNAESDDEFCESMQHLITLLAPSGRTSPSDTEATFTEAADWFDQARQSAPASISDDVDAYAAAYDEYIGYLDEVGYNLDAVFSTDEGSDLAIDTSHSLTVAIVEYTTNECGLSFEDG